MSAFLVLLRRELALAWGKGGGPLLALAFYAGVVTLPPSPVASWRRSAGILAVCLALWWLPILALGAWLGWASTGFKQGVFFSQAALVTFGGAYAVLPYVAQQAVASVLDQVQHLLETRCTTVIWVRHHRAVVAQAELRQAPQLAAVLGRTLRLDQGQVVPVHGQDEVKTLEIGVLAGCRRQPLERELVGPDRQRGEVRQLVGPHERFGQATWEVVRVVTAFTVAHSLTLGLAVLGLDRKSTRLNSSH